MSGDIRSRREPEPRQGMGMGMGASERGGSDWNERKPTRSFLSNDSLPTYYVIPIVIGICAIIGVVHFFDTSLPTPLTYRDVGQYPDRFVTERAQAHLHRLVALGPKPTGSYENEVLTVDYITKEISFTMQHSSPSQRIVFDLQKPTGSFHLAMLPYGFTTYYAGVQNIVVRLGAVNRNTSIALLVNCHFDTVPTSPGGSDDGINCAVMLEVLRILSLSDVPLAHDVIFLFNGAEENILQSSHGFITQHKWAKDVKAFVNLEACGAGGREVLFQSGPNHPWLFKAYADSVPHPHATVMAEEIFGSGLIPSDTDFRIFRDFGHIPGLDFAHARNGYVYHTKYDNEDQIPSGTFQHTGDNILELVRVLANSPQLGAAHTHNEGPLVFWDFLGLFVVRYSHLTGTVINFVVSLLSAYTVIGSVLHLGNGVRRSELARELGVAILGPAFGWFLALAWGIVVASGLDWLGSTMSWYSRPLLILPLYFSPAVLLATLGLVMQLQFMKQSVLCGSVRVRLYCLGVQLLWTLFLIAATLANSRSAYLLLLPVLCPSVISTVMLWCTPQQFSVKTWLAMHICSLIPPIMVTVYHGFLAFTVFIPITGRMGTTGNPEFLISILSTLLCLLACSYLAPLILLLRRPLVVLWSLAAVHLIALGFIMLTPLAFPFSISEPNGVYPQRVYLWHVERELHDEGGQVRQVDSGFWMLSMDRTGPESLVNRMNELKRAESAETYCESELFCALPLYAPRIMKYVKGSLWLPGPKPTIHQPTNLELVAQKMITTDTRRLTFTIQGPDHMGLMFSPVPGVSAVGWDLKAELLPSYSFNGRPAYFIYYGRGLEGRPWNVSLDFKVKDLSGPIVDINLAGHYMHISKQYSPEFVELLSRFPSWTHITPWVSSIKSWRF